jgi:nanoRNase/pAp phosphatase (c-di-AMP/oligoRNAs hydrolase)
MKQAIRESIRRAAEVVASAGEVALACHVSPDGDALGSMLGLAHAARGAGKRVTASFGSPFAVAAQYEFLGLGPLVPPEKFPAAPEVMVVLDVASADRLGELAGPASRAGALVVLDHHLTNPGFGHVAVVDPSAAATAQLVYHLLRRLAWPIDRPVATALLTGLVSDTGRFQYSSTDASVLRIAARLVEAGARPEEIGQSVYEWLPFGYLQVSGAVLSRARLEDGLVWSVLFRADHARAGVGPEDLDLLIDGLRIAREAEVAVLLREVEGGWKVSLRSRGAVDVGAVAAACGGGGHHNAAGFNTGGDPEAVLAAIRERLRG